VFGIYLLGGFFCHTLWEAHSQYALPYAFLLTPYSTAGIMETVNSLNGMDKKKLIKYALITAAICIILSLPQAATVLTLNRDNVRFAQYILNPY
ncbi:MAG: hypothetical protein IJ641_04605, partial [Lachnospiraceae bacterium]|nr:hypothetical protein [Lachnospiraceae bacterium]